VESNLHWVDRSGGEPYTIEDYRRNQFVHPGVDGSDWHTYVLEWRPNAITLSIDGGAPRLLTDNEAAIADWNMEPTFQLDAFPAFDLPGQQPTISGPVAMEVDYLLVQP
jgi:beta-glucanase (GH16 family)